ncbi:MAG TPA: M20/M25/M40 family metallo-hydrolase [Thermoanaerobaculia bacterium]|nr:M20/M25/M40 family metallo-hydrolase [Thermoanaerobaculia bacterium]
MRSIVSLLAALTLLAAAPIDDRLRRDVQVLASEEMEGRGLGTRGLDRAGVYIERRLREAGLAPAFGKSYQQRFPVKVGVERGGSNRLEGVSGDDWTPLAMSSAGAFDGEIVFIGYGIDAPAVGFREFEGIDLAGKVALVLRYEPQERDDASPFDGRRPSRWSAMRYKVLQARERKAAAVIFVTGPLQDEVKEKLPALANDGPESPAGIPVLQVKTSVAQNWLRGAGIDLQAFQNAVDRDLRPRSRPTGVSLRGNVDVKPRYDHTSNVVGILKGKGALANEVVVLGAHYDHLGWGGEGSMRPNARAIHHGADDNASGVAGVLSAAARLRQELRSVASHRTIVFALFSGEERGLAGSGYFVANAPFPMSSVKAMVNLDMVGQLREKLSAFGTESAPEWRAVVERSAAQAGIAVSASGDGYGPSDQTSFYAAQIPVLHFFTGAHERYHTPDDRAETLNYEGLEKVVSFTTRVVTSLARGDVSPTYARATSAPLMQGDSRGYGAYLGTVPDYSAMNETSGGVLLADVRPGSPAERAGLRGGDRLVEIAGTRIENLYDMTFALQDQKPGDTVDVVVMRKGARQTLRATLSSRGATPAAAAPAAHPTTQPGPPSAGERPPAPAPSSAAPAAAHPSAGLATGAAAGAPARPTANPFYAGRPGRDFAIGAGKPFARNETERHFTDIRQLTFGGENAEAYFSPDGKKLIYQATLADGQCDQQYVLDLTTGDTRLVSTGKGRTTCGYFDWPEEDRIIYSSTEGWGAECPPPPDRTHGYVWAIYPSFDIYEARLDGSQPRRLTNTPGYDAEATWCHRGGKLVFTSTRDGDLDLYEMDEAGSVRRLTKTPGYDGGAFYSPDCSEIVWRASYLTGERLEDYRKLLAQGLVRPTAMEIFVMRADGSDVRQITKNGAANFAPYFHPDGNRVIYASNVGDARGREFELWLADKRGGEPERITHSAGFDGFPMFSPDGEFIVWASNRSNPSGRETNLFVARWVE